MNAKELLKKYAKGQRLFTCADLRLANLTSADLSGADLRLANLTSADLSGADLTGAKLSGAKLSGANLSEADLTSANLSSAGLTGANLSGANLSGANLSEADFIAANLSGANLSEADFIAANLSGANLSEADFIAANLSGANLSSANLTDIKGVPTVDRASLISHLLRHVESDRFDQSSWCGTRCCLAGATAEFAGISSNSGMGLLIIHQAIPEFDLSVLHQEDPDKVKKELFKFA